MLGDHIRALKDGRWIHGIDLGTQQVLHLVEDPSLPAGHRLRRTYKPDFTEGAISVEVVIHRERVFPPRMVVARAFSRLADPAVVAAFRSSEQFAAWCKASRLPPAAEEAGRPARSQAGGKKGKAARQAAPKKAARKKKPPVKKAVARKAPPRQRVARAKLKARKPTRKPEKKKGRR
jgi:hypothetical protein